MASLENNQDGADQVAENGAAQLAVQNNASREESESKRSHIFKFESTYQYVLCLLYLHVLMTVYLFF